MHWLLSGLLVAVVLVTFTLCSEPNDTARVDPVGTAQERTEAITACEWLIERHARYDYEWTAWLDRFPQRGREGSVIVLAGNEVKFQNGFGAWQQMSYRCDYDTRTGKPSLVYLR